MNTINWQRKAIKQLRKLQPSARTAILNAVDSELVDLSAARNVKKLVNHEYGYRLRAGDYRVVFDYDGSVRIVSIEEVRKRDEQTY
ncbi:type II toxin-antitoxin system RelE/ParE family toxin [soil metagenome]